jgi:hypothetical protein
MEFFLSAHGLRIGKIEIFRKRCRIRKKLNFWGFWRNKLFLLEILSVELLRKRKIFNDIALKYNKMNQISIFFNKFLVLLIFGLASYD